MRTRRQTLLLREKSKEDTVRDLYQLSFRINQDIERVMKGTTDEAYFNLVDRQLNMQNLMLKCENNLLKNRIKSLEEQIHRLQQTNV